MQKPSAYIPLIARGVVVIQKLSTVLFIRRQGYTCEEIGISHQYTVDPRLQLYDGEFLCFEGTDYSLLRMGQEYHLWRVPDRRNY